MKIADIEAHLIERIKSHFDRRLRAVESLPSDFDAAEFDRISRSTPGVFISFGFGPAARAQFAGSATITGRWTVIAVAGNAGGEKQRRHGSQVEIGAYEMMERLIPLLHDYLVPDVGTLTFTDSDNLFTGELDKKGVAMYAAVFTMPMSFDSTLLDTNGLDDFLLFESDFDPAPQSTGVIPMHDATHLEQAT